MEVEKGEQKEIRNQKREELEEDNLISILIIIIKQGLTGIRTQMVRFKVSNANRYIIRPCAVSFKIYQLHTNECNIADKSLLNMNVNSYGVLCYQAFKKIAVMETNS